MAALQAAPTVTTKGISRISRVGSVVLLAFTRRFSHFNRHNPLWNNLSNRMHQGHRQTWQRQDQRQHKHQQQQTAEVLFSGVKP